MSLENVSQGVSVHWQVNPNKTCTCKTTQCLLSSVVQTLVLKWSCVCNYSSLFLWMQIHSGIFKSCQYIMIFKVQASVKSQCQVASLLDYYSYQCKKLLTKIYILEQLYSTSVLYRLAQRSCQFQVHQFNLSLSAKANLKFALSKGN